MIPAFLVTKFGPATAKLIFYGGIVLLVILAIGGFALYERHVGAAGEVHKQDQQIIRQQATVSRANDNAGDRRVVDAVTLQRETQEIANAHAPQAGDTADSARVRGVCVILRQQGRDTSSYPACR